MGVYLLFLLFFSCSDFFQPTDKNFFVAKYDMNNLQESDLFESYEILGTLDNKEIDEASGIVVSRQDPTLIWTHNDSGDSNRIFLIRNDGTYLGTFLLNDASNRDWEEIAIGPGPVQGLNYLYVGDIGDNSAQYKVKHIYRFPEPDVTLANPNVQWTNIQDVETISFEYADNKRKDAETMFVDPWTGDIYIISKREAPLTVYRLPYPQGTTETMIAEKYGTLPFTFATAGDISADGKQIIIKTYDKVFLWTRDEDESIADAFMSQPIRLSYTPEPQGEAIAFPEDTSGYYTLSEARRGVKPVVYFYKRKN